MSYSLIKVTSYYKDFIVDYYKQNQQIINTTYQEQYKDLMFQSNSWADFYSKNLQKIGVEASEIVANAEHLQNQWAKENNSPKKGIQLVLEQIEQLKPDVVWFQDSLTFNGQLIRDIRSSVTNLKLVIGNSCAPYTKEHLKLFREFDFITTCSPLFKKEFEKNDFPALLLYQAFEQEVIKRVEVQENIKQQDLIFIGNLLSGADGHNIRKQFLEELIKNNINISFFGNITNINKAEVLKKQIIYIYTKIIENTGLSSVFRNSIIFKKGQFLTSFPKKNKISNKLINSHKPSLHGLKMFRAIADSKIGLNIHGDKAGDFAANMRMFETTGIGTCLLTDWKKNIHELFEPDKEILTYKSVDECIEKTKWLLDNPEKLKEITVAGQKRTLKEHNYLIRAKTLNDFILEKLEKLK